MGQVIFGIKAYTMMFIGMFLVGVALNQTTRKEYRQSLKQVWREHLRVFGSLSLVALVMLCVTWFMFSFMEGN
ncbi:hypothetical protein [Buttiauxella noackiae]|uniref:hypothetical protein n=1 Tax=Buttiauxella noackiae TaxID=82992 RepID=UPI0023547E7C|nr:hypothetical protein [Buttiauxella noackiae]MCA1920968.1 hypothetical protein [Buttiauxella noackiae]